METKVEKKLYEGMFLVDSADAGSDWDGINTAIEKTLERAEAEIVSIRKWDDRKLAYDIKGTSRGTYILCYFKADGDKIQGIEKDVQLSEKIIRVLILSTEQMSKEDIEKDTPAVKAEKEKEKALAVQAEDAQESPQSDEEQDSTAEDTEVAEEVQTSEETEAAEEAQTEEGIEVTEQQEPQEDTERPEQVEQEQIKAEESEDEGSEPKFMSGD